jgi:hypothetical protein
MLGEWKYRPDQPGRRSTTRPLEPNAANQRTLTGGKDKFIIDRAA